MKLCIIPARGGSKRVPRKNIRPFAGRPIIAYSIQAALQTRLFDSVIVSTDDAEIAEVAKTWGAEVPFLRPAALADDHTGTVAVVKHAIQWHLDRGAHPTQVCCLYATAPFIQSEHLIGAYRHLAGSGKPFVFSVTSYPFPIQRALRINQSGEIEALHPEFRMIRSQDLEPAWHDAGQFYWGTAAAFLEELPIFAPHSLPHVLPPYLVQDIDTEEDWQRAELMYLAWKGKGSR